MASAKAQATGEGPQAESEPPPASPEPAPRYFESVDDVRSACLGRSDPNACFLMAFGGELHNGTAVPPSRGKEADASLERACKTDVDGLSCLSAALYVAREEGDTAPNRRRVAEFAGRSCEASTPEMRSESCGFYEKARSRVYPGDLTGVFPRSLAGVAFGVAPAAVASLCDFAAPAGERRMLCRPAPKPPFPGADGLLVGFCGGKVCEIVLSFENHMPAVQVDSVLSRLVKRYGEPVPLEIRVPCASAVDREKQWRQAWHSAEGGIIAAYTCSAEPNQLSFVLVYHTAEGQRAAAREVDDF